MTDAEKIKVLVAVARLMSNAVKQTQGGTATLGRLALETPEGMTVLAFALDMMARDEI